jgi:hypothetical protein
MTKMVTKGDFYTNATNNDVRLTVLVRRPDDVSGSITLRFEGQGSPESVTLSANEPAMAISGIVSPGKEASVSKPVIIEIIEVR